MTLRKYLFLLFAFVVLAFIGMEIIDNWIASRRLPRCSDFTYQEDAQNAYNNGYLKLDGRDKDKIACESLPHKPLSQMLPFPNLEWK